MAEARPRTESGRRLTVRQLPRAEIAEVFRRFAAAQPNPKGELAYKNPFTLLVAVVLSAQATDAGVNRATPALFAKADTAEKMAALEAAGIHVVKSPSEMGAKVEEVYRSSSRVTRPSKA